MFLGKEHKKYIIWYLCVELQDYFITISRMV